MDNVCTKVLLRASSVIEADILLTSFYTGQLMSSLLCGVCCLFESLQAVRRVAVGVTYLNFRSRIRHL